MLDASVIIPTYNRLDSLLCTLRSLASQRDSSGRFEVVVVDDGSSDETQDMLSAEEYPFRFRYVRQSNRGSAAARNTGADRAEGEILIFVDDDMTLGSDYVAALVQEQRRHTRIIGMGREQPYVPPDASSYARFVLQLSGANTGDSNSTYVDFTDCVTNNLAVNKAEFYEIGGMQDIGGDGPTWWGDVDFGYRAYLSGFRFVRSGKAQCVHRDYSTEDFPTNCVRHFNVSKMAVLLAQKHPAVLLHLPMFADMTPVCWGKDGPALVSRKVGRRISAAPFLLFCMEKLISTAEQHYPARWMLANLYRWVLGGYIYCGFREGIRQHGPIPSI